ncbi:MAG: type II secretion system F family protein [bacterium]|nr:type II secretion system F family protein [bacterium]
MDESKRLELLRHFTYEIEEVKSNKWLTVDLNKIIPGSYSEKLSQGGIDFPKEVYIGAVVILSLVIGYLCLFVGKFLALYAFAMNLYFFLFPYVSERAEKRRKKIVPQIPSFLDGLTAALNTGYSLDAALTQGTNSVPKGLLRNELENAVTMLNSGMTLSESFRRIRQRIVGREIISVVSALDLFSSMGGRMMDPFDRLGRKIREQEQALARANRDLVQIKQAFLIIGGLSVLAPFFVFLLEPGYIMTAFDDEFGRLLLQVGFMMEITAIFVFKNLINLKI